jgi:hypothetical protein
VKVTAAWLTLRRLRTHGLILALCLWSVYVWDISSPGLRDRAGNLKGTDLLHLYTLGSLALAHDGADLYNMRAQSDLAAARVPAAKGINYLPLYPPQVSILFVPFAEFSYTQALIAWLALSSAIYIFCCYMFWRACPHLQNQKVTILILALAFPAFWHLILWGQTSALALACFTAVFFALRAKREFLAGVAFGCLIFKPQLGLAVAIVFIFGFRRRVMAGALVSSSLQLLTAVLYYGFGPLHSWMQAQLRARNQLGLLEPKPYQTHCLRTFWSMLIPEPSFAIALYILSGVFIAALLVSCWRSQLSLSLRFSTLLFASVLLAPHLTVYDLVILAPAFLLLSDSLIAQPPAQFSKTTAYLGRLLYFAFVLPLLGPLARWTHLQLSVPVMAGIIYTIWKSREQKAELDSQTAPGYLASEQKL